MRSRGGVLIVLAAVLLAGAALRIAAAVHHVRVDYDEGRYLDNAVHLIRGDGFATSTVSHYFDDPPRPPRPEDFSSPLYPILLAGLLKITGVSFGAVRAMNVILSVAAIPLAFLLGRRLFGAGAGLAAAAALALQPDQAIVGGWAMTEPLYMVVLIVTLLAAAPLAFPRSDCAGAGRAILLGLLCGLLYLIRQNGIAVAAALAALLVAGPRGPGERRVRRAALAAVMAAAALALCAPWFARNAAAFGSATFTRMKNVGWADHARSLYTPGIPTPSLRRYMEDHGLKGVASSLARRARRAASATLFAESGPFRWLSVLALAAPFLPRLRRGAALCLPAALLSAALFIGVAPWSGALPRYLLPVRPLLYVAGSAVALGAWGAFAGRAALAQRARRIAGAAVVGAGLAWAATAAAPVYGAYMRGDQAGPNAAALEAAAWIRAHTDPDVVLLEGGFLHQYAFLFERGVVWVPYGDLRDLFGVAERYRAAYLAITPEVIRFRPGLSRHWIAEGRSLQVLDAPAELEAVYDRARDGVILYAIGRQGGGPALE